MEPTWRPKYEFPDISNANLIAIDTETRDPELDTKGPGGVRGVGEIVGVSVAVDGWSNYYPIAHQGGDNLPKDVVLRWLQKALGGKGAKVGANVIYDLEWLDVSGVKVEGEIHDIQVREALIDENQTSYDADTLFTKYGLGGKSHDVLYAYARSRGHTTESQIKKNLWTYPARYVGEYAIQDAVGALGVFHAQQSAIEAELKTVYALEVKVTRILFKMRMQGVPVDVNKAEEAIVKLRIGQKEAQERLNFLAGFSVDPWSAKSIQVAFDKVGLEYPSTEKGNPSFVAKWLESHGHDLPQAIVRIRRFDRTASVFLQKKVIDVAYRGRIYPSFKQTRSEEGGTRSGRFASSNPNIQQVPARDPVMAPIVRGVFVAPKGKVWGVHDYSQQEPRITVHYAALRGFRGADEARRRYIDDPSTDYHDLTKDIVFEKSGLDIGRKSAKNINLGITYTMGGAKLCRQLGLPTKHIPHWRNPDLMVEVAGDEGKAILDAYHLGMPFIRELMDECSRVVKRRGYIRTILGRLCHLPPSKAHVAINRLIQGSAADMTKQAMVDLDESGYGNLPLFQVHDELDHLFDEGPEGIKQAKFVSEVMIETGRKMGVTVPMMVDTELGPSWGEVEEI